MNTTRLRQAWRGKFVTLSGWTTLTWYCLWNGVCACKWWNQVKLYWYCSMLSAAELRELEPYLKDVVVSEITDKTPLSTSGLIAFILCFLCEILFVKAGFSMFFHPVTVPGAMVIFMAAVVFCICVEYLDSTKAYRLETV